MSIVVSTPSARMPPSSQSALTPVPVPISITDRAPSAAASRRSAAPVPAEIGVTPTSVDIARATRRTSSSAT